MTIAAVAVVLLAAGTATGRAPLPAAAAIAVLVPAAVIDVRQHRLPDVWVLAGLFVLLAALAVDSAVGQAVDVDTTFRSAIGGAAAMTMPLLALHLVSPTSMGFGDVKAAAVLGAAVGTTDWRLGAVALCVAALTGAGLGLATRRRTIAFGPFLVFGAALVVLAHQPLSEALFAGGATP